MKRALKIVGGVVLACLLVAGSFFGYLRWQFHLPSDASAKAFFHAHHAHRQELDALVATVRRQPSIKFVNADWIGQGDDAKDPAHIACAKILKQLGAQHLNQSDGMIQIYFWGSGCAVCHDSYKGFAFTPAHAPGLKYLKVLPSLEDSDLPHNKQSGIEDGSYFVPVSEDWSLIRWECG